MGRLAQIHFFSHCLFPLRPERRLGDTRLAPKHTQGIYTDVILLIYTFRIFLSFFSLPFLVPSSPPQPFPSDLFLDVP